VSEKRTEKARNRELLLLATNAQKLLQEFIRLPFTEPERATELLHEFDRAVVEFKRLQSAIVASQSKRARVFRLEEARAPRLCPICHRRIVLPKRNYVEMEGAIYHRACYGVVVGRQPAQGRS
jgi:hypothetical protein